MRRGRERTPWFTIAGLFLTLYFFRVIEYFYVRLDQGVMGEAVLHLILGLVILLALLKRHNLQLRQIGFTKTHAPRELINGGLFAGFVFLLTYSMEFFILRRLGRSPRLAVYLSKYVLEPDGQDHLIALNVFALAAGSLLSVFAEEGIFRGFFIYLAEKKTNFYRAVFISSLLYGLWASVLPLRYLIYGRESLFMAISLGGLVFVFYFLQGIKYSLEYELTGSLWFPLSDHFVHYTLVRVLHVETNFGTDELFIMRVAFAQAFSLICVLVVFLKVRHFASFFEKRERDH